MEGHVPQCIIAGDASACRRLGRSAEIAGLDIAELDTDGRDNDRQILPLQVEQRWPVSNRIPLASNRPIGTSNEFI